MVKLISDTLLLTVKSDCIGSKWEETGGGRKAAIAMVATPIEANCLLALWGERVSALPFKLLSWSPGFAGYAPGVVVVVWSRYQGPLVDVVDLVS